MRVALLAMALGLGTVAGAQVAAPKPVGWALVLDKPYTGVRTYEREQKTGDGHTVKGHEVSRFSRDSAGADQE